VRRAIGRLRLTPAQADAVRELLREERRHWRAAQQLLVECRHQLGSVLAAPVPDSTAVLELSVQERVLEERERALAARIEEGLAALLRPDQAVRLRALAPVALGEVVQRLGA
jgi:Spy/CpxP family protein refolding chaperone